MRVTDTTFRLETATCLPSLHIVAPDHTRQTQSAPVSHHIIMNVAPHHAQHVTYQRRIFSLRTALLWWMFWHSVSTLSSRPSRVVTCSALAFSSNMKDNAAAAMQTSRRRRRRIVDTDAGFDDVVAIQSLLAHNYSVDLVTTVCGSNTATETFRGLRRLFPQLDIVRPQDTNRPRPAQGWLTDFRRRFANFVNRHGVSLSGDDENDKSVDDPLPSPLSRVQAFLESSADASVDLICLGPLSNVADWCRAFPTLLQAKVDSVWILGGAHPNVARTDEFNFGQDAAAAHAVLQSALRHKITLVPGDATAHDLAPPSFVPAIMDAVQQQHFNDNTTTTNSNLLAHVVREEQQYSIFYDPVCAFLYLNPHAAQFSHVRLVVCPQTGVTQLLSSADHDELVAIPVAQQVDFEAYQAWLLQAIRQSDPTSTCVETSS